MILPCGLGNATLLVVHMLCVIILANAELLFLFFSGMLWRELLDRVFKFPDVAKHLGEYNTLKLVQSNSILN